MSEDTLDEEHPLWCVNEQIKGLLDGCGATEDHEAVLSFLRSTGLPDGTVRRMHHAIVKKSPPAQVEHWINKEVTVVFKEIPPDLDIQIHKYHGTMLARDGNMVLFKFPTARAQVWVNLWSTSSITYREP